MPIDKPNELVNEFKESGEFERLRRELLAQFQQSEGKGKLKAQIEEKVQQRFQSDAKLRFSSQANVHKELMLEIDRFPIVERAVGEVQLFSDTSFIQKIDDKLDDILTENRGRKPRNARTTRTWDSMDNTSSTKPSSSPIDARPRAPLPPKPITSEVAIVVTSPTQGSAPLPPAAQGEAVGAEPTAKTAY